MGSVDRDDNRIIKMNFSTDGAAKLRESVTEKLKEFMGEYTDDTLVEYVIVILRNGKSKEQAKNELNVFLGDDSDSFVSWLWDHLHLNLALYVKPEKPQDEAPKRKLISKIQSGGDGFQQSKSELERGNSSKSSRSRHNKDWKGLVREAEVSTIRISEVDNAHLEEKVRPKDNRGRKSLSPKPAVQRKRDRADEQQRTKRDTVSQVNIAAPRRLLQFAVRDAVGTPRTPTFGTSVEPSLKRLRSVVSTSSADSALVEHYQHAQPTSRVPNAMATVIKAVAEAAEDVKSKSSGSVFDRLGCGMDSLAGNSQLDYQHQEQNQSVHLQRTNYDGQYAANTTMTEHETGFPYDSNSDNEGCHDLNVIGRGVTGTSQISSSVGNRGSDSLMVQYSVAKNADDILRLKQNREQEQSAAAHNTSRKIVNISVNVNTWKPEQYQEPREVVELDGHNILDKKTGESRSNMHLVKENANALKISNGNVNIAPGVQKESIKANSTTGSGVAGRPSEDVDSRTIFVSNVHFAATKDGLSQHFNKFGEVLKVIIVTDAATGQPKGAAYVEFMLKEAADNALSLDGTSFMSRILKVVRKSAAHQESAPTTTWPHVVRGSSFPTARFPRPPFARGIPGSFRPRPPMKLGARSMQWKRGDTPANPANSGSSVNTGNITMPATRGLTYVRTQSKPEGLGTT